MKHIIYSLLFAVFLMAGCSDDKPTLYVYNWSDYIDPDLLAQFEAEYDCKVSIDTFDDNESMLAKLLAGGGGYDLIFPSSYTTPVMVNNDMLAPLNTNALPNVVQYLDHKYDKHFHDATLKYSIPYAFSVTGVAYRKDKLPEGYVVTNSWNLLKDPHFSGRMCMLRDIREVFGMGLKMCSYSINTTNKAEIAQALKVIKGFKKCAAKLDNEQYRTGIVNGELLVCMGYVCDVVQIMQASPDCPIGFFVPQEGSTCCWDEIVIAKNSEKKELAHKFIDFLYRPEVAAKNAEYVCAIVPHNGTSEYLSKEYKDNQYLNVSQETLDLLEPVADLGPNISLYLKPWDVFTTNRD